MRVRTTSRCVPESLTPCFADRGAARTSDAKAKLGRMVGSCRPCGWQSRLRRLQCPPPRLRCGSTKALLRQYASRREHLGQPADSPHARQVMPARRAPRLTAGTRLAMLVADAERLTAMSNATSDRQAHAAKCALSATLGALAMIWRNESMIRSNQPAGNQEGLCALQEDDRVHRSLDAGSEDGPRDLPDGGVGQSRPAETGDTGRGA